MKNYQFFIFLAIVLSIYSAANIYIYLKGYNAISGFRTGKILYFVIFLLLASTFVAGKIMESRHSSVFSDILNIIGGFWMGFILYTFMFLVISDIAGLFLRIPGVVNDGNIMIYRKWAYIFTVSLTFLLIAGGFINAVIPVVKDYEIAIDKPAGDVKSMKIAAVSDIHLGSIIRKRSIRKLSDMLDSLKPDAVFLLGDIIDGEIGPVLRGDLLKHFRCPHCDAGMYAITGNHEFIGGADRTVPYIESKGIRILKDEVAELPGGIQLIGRLDRDSRRFYGKERLPLEELVRLADTSKPMILLDHQPIGLDEAEKNGIDLQLSGHTHNGQIWPLNYITRMVYELSYGYRKKGNTHYIVSSGYGLWGPRIRSGSRSEVVLINITFADRTDDAGR